MQSSVFPFIFQKRLFAFLFSLFIAFAIMGVFTYIGGFYLSKRYCGVQHFETSYNGQMVSYYTSPTQLRYSEFNEHRQNAINNNQLYKDQIILDELQQDAMREGFVHSAAPQLLIMLYGTIGLISVLLCRKHYTNAIKLKVWQWILIMLSLFWMEQIIELIFGLIIYMLTGNIHFVGLWVISKSLGLPILTINVITSLVAIFIFILILFEFIPFLQRFTFILAGLAAALCGYILWGFAGRMLLNYFIYPG